MLDDSAHISIRHRIAQAAETAPQRRALAPIAGAPTPDSPQLNAAECVSLLDWVGRQAHPAKRGTVVGPPPAVLARAVDNPQRWTQAVVGIETDYWRAVGAVDALLAKAHSIGQLWLQRLGVARTMVRSAAVD